MKIKTNFSKLLRRWRTDSDMLQKEAATKLGVSVRTYQSWEESRTTPHSIAIAEIERRMGK